MRAIWKGTLNFGLIAIPVGLAVTHKKGDIGFRTLHARAGRKRCGLPIEQLRSCPEHGPVEDAELCKGWEVAPNQFVPLDDQELEAVAPDGEERAIELAAFVPVEELPLLGIGRSYYLAPSEQPVGRRPYAALAQALRELDMAGVGRFVAWQAEHLCTIRPVGARALALQTLRFPCDLEPPDEIDELLTTAELDEQEGDLARELVLQLFGKLEEQDLTPHHRERVRALLEGKPGSAIVRSARAPKQSALPTVDLAEALRRSISEAPRRRKRMKKAAKRAKSGV